MKRIYDTESALDRWNGTDDENVIALLVDRRNSCAGSSGMRILAEIEAHPETDSMRVLAVDDFRGWEMPASHPKDATIFDVISEMSGLHAGGIHFYYETEEEIAEFGSAHFCMFRCVSERYPTMPISMLEMSYEEYRGIRDLLADGIYIIRFGGTLKGEKP